MNRILPLAIAALAFVVLPLRADEPSNLPSELAAVPPGAIGFIHLRAADLWKSDALKELRASMLRAGPAALKAFNDRFVPAPSTIDCVTVIILDPRQAQREPPLVGVISCSEPFDRGRMYKSLLPKGKELKAGDATFVADEELEIALHAIDNRTLAVAPTETMKQYLEGSRKGPGPFASALKEASGKHHLVVALNASLLPGEAVGELPEALQPLARAKLARLSLDIGQEIRADVRLEFGDEAQAKAGEAAAHQGVMMAREALKGFRMQLESKLMPPEAKGAAPISELPEALLSVAGLGAINQAEEYLDKLPLKRQGESLALSIAVPAGPYTALLGMSGLSAAFVFPAARVARMGGAGNRSANNLKQIMLAFHNYHDTFNGFPSAAICDKNGKPLLSWRVAILPFIEQDALYKQFHLDEPWDSEHNKKLIPMMPKVYAQPNAENPAADSTPYRVFYGNGAALELKKSVRIVEFTDGTSNTVVVVEAAEPVVWTKPDEFEYSPDKPLPKLGKPSADGFWVAMGDGSVRFVKKTISEKTLRAVITRNGGEIIGPDFE
jgi:hypothetical protein